MTGKSFTPEVVAARQEITAVLDRISPGTYGTNTLLLEAVERLIEVKISEAVLESLKMTARSTP